MADATTTLAAVLNMGDANVGFTVSDLLQGVPLLNALAAVPSTHGHTHKYLRETAAAGAAFRAVGAGVANAGGSVELTTVTLKFLDASWERDVALAKAMFTGKGGVEAYVSGETMRSTKAGLVAIEKQVIYGDQSPGSTAGFAGLVDAIDASMRVNGTGSTAVTQTSVYAIRSGPEAVAVVYNGDNNGTIDVSEAYKVRDEDGSGNPLTLLRCDIDGYLGFQAGNKYNIGRLANLHPTDDGAQLDDDKLAALIALFPVDNKPTHLAMNRAAQEMLRKSRTATNATGAPAPIPMEAFGIPIVVTDTIISTEAVVSFA
jgi:hypothetical protein